MNRNGDHLGHGENIVLHGEKIHMDTIELERGDWKITFMEHLILQCMKICFASN